MPFTDEHKKHLEVELVQTLITGLEKEQIMSDQLSDIATAILARLDLITNQDELAEFLTELSAKWPIFQNLLQIELGKVKSELEKKVAHDVLQLARTGNIEDAIKLAQTMTKPTQVQ